MEPKKKKKTAERAEELVRAAVEEAGYVLWNVEYVKEGADHTLLVTIEKKDAPIGLDDCEKVTKIIDPILDEADPIEESYYLEVSSPGLERELKRPEHFSAYLGEKVRVRLYAPVNGQKEYRGVLAARENGRLVLETASGKTEFETEKVAKVFADDADGETEENERKEK